MTFSENLSNIKNQIIADKQLIATALNNKGQTATTGNTFEEYATKINSIEGGSATKLYNGISFSNYSGQTIDVSKYDFSEMTNMSWMFNGCYNLIEIPSINASNVTNMSYMCSGCTKLTTVNNLNTSNVIKMAQTFQNCTELTNIENLDLSKIEDGVAMFSGCTKLKSVPAISSTNLLYEINLFYNCYILENVPFINVSKVSNFDGTFNKCFELTNLNLIGLGTHSSSKSLYIEHSSKLSKDSIVNMFNNAFDRATAGYSTFTLSLHADAKARLTTEEIAIATAKGFTVA